MYNARLQLDNLTSIRIFAYVSFTIKLKEFLLQSFIHLNGSKGMTLLLSSEYLHEFYEDFICSVLKDYLDGGDCDVIFGKARDDEGHKRFVLDSHMHNRSLLGQLLQKHHPAVPSTVPEMIRCVVGSIPGYLFQRLRNCLRLKNDEDLYYNSNVFNIGTFDIRYDQVSGWLQLTLRKIHGERVLRIKVTTIFPE